MRWRRYSRRRPGVLLASRSEVPLVGGWPSGLPRGEPLDADARDEEQLGGRDGRLLVEALAGGRLAEAAVVLACLGVALGLAAHQVPRADVFELEVDARRLVHAARHVRDDALQRAGDVAHAARAHARRAGARAPPRAARSAR